MQMRYQLRHSPRCCPRVEAPRTTRGILANRPASDSEIERHGAVVGVQPPGRVGGTAAEHGPAAVVHARAASARPRTASRAGRPRRCGSRRRARRPGRPRPRGRRAAISVSAAVIRAATSACFSAPGTASQLARTNSAYSAGASASNSWWYSPSRGPREYSRSRASNVGREAATRRRRTTPSSGPGRSPRTTAAAGRSAASTGATASAWACPRSSSWESACPWIRRAAFQSVRPCRSRTGPGQPRSGAVTSAGSGMVGQSRQSRSSA